MNRVSGMGGTAANGGPSARKLAIDVPGAPGAYREMRSPLRIVSSGTLRSLSIMNIRPNATTRIVRVWATWKPPVGSGSS